MCLSPDSNQYVIDANCDDSDVVLDNCTSGKPGSCNERCGDGKAFREHSTVRCQSSMHNQSFKKSEQKNLSCSYIQLTVLMEV